MLRSIALCRAVKDALIRTTTVAESGITTVGRHCGWIDKGDCTYFIATSYCLVVNWADVHGVTPRCAPLPAFGCGPSIHLSDSGTSQQAGSRRSAGGGTAHGRGGIPTGHLAASGPVTVAAIGGSSATGALKQKAAALTYQCAFVCSSASKSPKPPPARKHACCPASAGTPAAPLQQQDTCPQSSSLHVAHAPTQSRSLNPRRARDAVTAKVSSEDSIAVLRAAAVPLEGVDDAAAVSRMTANKALMTTDAQSPGDHLAACLQTPLTHSRLLLI